jgi:hypothetical protein
VALIYSSTLLTNIYFILKYVKGFFSSPVGTITFVVLPTARMQAYGGLITAIN